MRFPIVAAVLALVVLGSCSRESEQDLLSEAERAVASREYDTARQLYLRLLEEYPQTSSRPDILYTLGTIYQNTDEDFPRAISYFRTLAAEYPDHPRTSNALFLIGFIYNNDLGAVDSARSAYELFLSRYPDHEMAESARFELDHLGKNPDDILTQRAGKP